MWDKRARPRARPWPFGHPQSHQEVFHHMSHPAPEQIRPERTGALEELTRDPSSRKRFFKLMGGGVGATSALAFFSPPAAATTSRPARRRDRLVPRMGGTTTATTGGDVDIVNYALTLEYLEADFYEKVVASGLFKGAQLDLIKMIGEHEQKHVDALTATVEKLGGKPAAKPKTKFPLDSAKSVLELAATVENLGAAAYLGQAGQDPEQGGPRRCSLDPFGRGAARLCAERC